MLDFHYNLAPNPKKVALFLEEAGLAYNPIPVDTRRGDQHAPAYVALNPNAKAPTIVEADGTVVFDSNAILLYLAEKQGAFLGAPDQRAALLSWLMFVATGIGPYNGQSVHFQTVRPDLDYPRNRYLREAQRHFGVIDRQIGDGPFVLGESYTIVDMALWGWTLFFDRVMGGTIPRAAFPNLDAWMDRVDARPAAARAKALGADHPWKTEMDDDAMRAMFPSNY